MTQRLATFNAALSRPTAGQLITELTTPHSQPAQRVAEIIQRVQPDVLILQELDDDPHHQALQLFQNNYLHISQTGASPIHFKYTYSVPSNTGIPSGMDLDQDGKTDSPSDALGFGAHPGQYAFAILTNYPIQWERIRTFQKFLWQDLPAAKLPKHPQTGTPWYSEAQLAILPLASKNQVDVPIEFPDGVVHLLVAHPAPPVFDGPEGRNRLRNFDEIRLLADYLSPKQASYLYDDHGQRGGLETSAHFVIMGDLNADPVDGHSLDQAITQLLHHPQIHPQVALGKQIPASLGGLEQAQRYPSLRGNPAYHTTAWGLRVDYVLPSKTFVVHDSQVFWPPSSHPWHYLVEKLGDGQEASSDHRLVWVDVSLT